MKNTSLPPRKFALVRTGLKRSSPVARLSRPVVSGTPRKVSQDTRQGKVVCDSLQRPVARKKKPLRFGGIPQNPKFLAFTRTKPCVLIGKTWTGPLGTISFPHICSGKTEAAHTGRRGYGQKAADETALPMCVSAHRTGRCHHHQNRDFFDRWGINRKVLVESNQSAALGAGVKLGEKYLESIK